MRGALVEFMDAFSLPVPNVIIFQFNPETITHAWTQAQPSSGGANPLAVQGFPGESFSLNIAMDASDMIADGSVVAQALATVSGIYSRLAALEMLLYPVPMPDSGLLAAGAAAASLAGGGSTTGVPRSVPQYQLPAVLFVWGPGRIVPVRVTGLSITERLYDPLLNPTHAEAQLSLTVMTPQDLNALTGPLKSLAQGAYDYSQALRQALAIANLANAAESIIGMLPI